MSKESLLVRESRLRDQTWSWLLAFVTVAETGSIGAAARQLSLTPAAVSRTVRLLEDRLGQQLFNRVGRTLALNVRGERLMRSVQSARDAVDRGLLALHEDPFAGALRVASLGVLSEHFVVPAMIELRQQHPQLLPEHLNLRAAQANDALARGQVDVAFQYEALSADALVIERIGHTTMSVYCGRGHPLFGQRRVTERKVLDQAFSVPQTGDSGRAMDGWPVELPRKVGMRVTLLRSNVQVAESGALLAVLPDVAARDGLANETLWRLSTPALPTIEVFAAYPASVDRRGSVLSLVQRVRELLGEQARPAQPSARKRATGRAAAAAASRANVAAARRLAPKA